MRLRFEMVMVPNNPKELKSGMLCRSVADDADPNFFYFLEDGSDLTPDGLHESVLPFIVQKDGTTESDIEKDKAYLFRFVDGGCCIACRNEISDMSEVVSAHAVMVQPEHIGLVHAEGYGSRNKKEISKDDINRIMANDGWCYIEVDDEFTAPERFEHVYWGDSEPEVKLEEERCIISF